MKKAITLIVVSILLVSFTLGCGGGDGGSASDVANAFYKAGNEGDYEKAKDYLSIHLIMGIENMSPLGMGFENMMDGVTNKGTIQKIEVKGGEELPGGYQALVYVTLHYSDGDQEQDQLVLQKEDGKWKIMSSILLATGAFK